MRSLNAFSGQRVELAIADFDKRKFGYDKESVQQYQSHDDRQFGKEQYDRVPLARLRQPAVTQAVVRGIHSVDSDTSRRAAS